MNNTVKALTSATAIVCLMLASAGAADTMAEKSSHMVKVDGVNQSVSAYMIGGNNYFKLRDIAAMVDNSPKQFEIIWNGAQSCIELQSGKGYTEVGGELQPLPDNIQKASYSTAKILKDGDSVFLSGYEINDNNYYKLRDVAYAFDFGVEWDGAAQTIVIDTDACYVPTEEETATIERKAVLYAEAQKDLRSVEQQSAMLDRELEGVYIQVQINRLIGEQNTLWQDALERMEQRIKQALPDDAYAAFTVLQQAWYTERQQQMDAAGNEFLGGSMQVPAEYMKSTELTRQRLYDMLVFFK